MKSHRHLLLLMVVAVVFTFACSLFKLPAAYPPATETPMEVPATPTEPSPPPLYLPRGVVTSTVENSTLTIFDRQGYTLAVVHTPGLSFSGSQNVHIAGSMPEGMAAVPVVYFSFEQNNSLLLTVNDQVTTLITTPFFAGMTGEAGKPIVAYTTVEYGTNALRSQLFAGSVQSLPGAAPALTIDDPEGWAMVVLAIKTVNDQPVGVWYSRRPWGIGGDIVFEPRRTLSYLDLSNGTSTELLGPEANPCSLSFSRTWVAYSGAPGVAASLGPMSIRNLENGAGATFPLLPATDQRGAGQAVFSPGDRYVAWMEASGWLMAEDPSFQSIIRVVDLNGNIIAEFTDSALVDASGLGTIGRVEPVGWFDDQTLVVQAHGSNWDQVVLMLIDIPGKTPVYLAQGEFIGFVYP